MRRFKEVKNFAWLSCILLAVFMISGCSSSDNDAIATETRQAEYEFWGDIAKSATEASVKLLNKETGQTDGKPEMIVLTNAGYAMTEQHSTEACLDSLRDNAGVSEGKKTLLTVHSASTAPLWFFFTDKANGNGVYCEVDPAALNLTGFKVAGDLFAVQNLRNVKADNLFAAPETANENIFNAKAFNGNEFHIISLVNLLLEDGPCDLLRAAQYHDHYCPGVTSGYFLVRYLENTFPLTDDFGKYFTLSVPPWCKDDALLTLLNATPGKRGYAVFYLNSDDKASLRDDAKAIASVFFRWNGSSTAPEGEGMALSFDFTEAKAACNWEEDTPWNWWVSRIKMDLWYLDYTDEPQRFVQPIPIKGKNIFSLEDLAGISQPSDLARPGVNPLEILGLTQNSDTDEYALWQSVGKRAGDEALAMMKAQGASPLSGNLIALTNAGYAEISGQTTEGSLDGLIAASGVSRGRNSLIEIQAHPDKALWFSLYDKASGLCAYLQVNPAFPDSNLSPSALAASELFSVMSAEQVNADHLYANAAEYAAKFSNKVFGGNEFRVVTISNAVAAGAPVWAIRSFELHDHYCPGVTSGILMAQYVKDHFPMQTASDSYFIQSVAPWCKEDALMVMLNATPGKRGYAVSYPTDEDKARWVPEAENAATIVYRKNGDTGIWDGLVLAFEWGETGCPDYGSSVITYLCSDLWYLERMDQPETFVKVVKEFQLPEGVEAKEYARPGVDPMEMLGLVQTDTEE
ncbi:hypothetical protein DENIS_4328 [Desulfonema ishimotonii]|uniref:Formylmethanofuran dehydrogenase subunit E domain-containing protein n=2 Tax=Desulfonema ishimotonii TaxID=45657 RepID=A0A401G293_9BACT|nr:hypothetical protein DENIS_4328 [Desulfonema ishimotonii]